MLDLTKGAQRASSHRSRGLIGFLLASFVLALTASVTLAASPPRAAALSAAPVPSSVVAAAPKKMKVVVVVGPVGSSTSDYISIGKRLAAKARSYGATVIELYSPSATWTRVKSATSGANMLIYLGHGNGSPSPYAGGNDTHNGLGLNASASGSNSNVRYYGETYITRYIRLAANAVVIFNRLCYASGNNEWGKGNPTRSVAMQRVDNFGEGFLKAGAAAVFAEGITDPGYIITRLFTTNRTMSEIFWASSSATRNYQIAFSSKQVTGAKALMDPYEPNRYYRSVVGRLTVTAADWR